MISEETQSSINKFLKSQTFEYVGPVIMDTTFTINYKFKLSGIKKMISVGEYYDYQIVDIEIIDIDDKLKKILKIILNGWAEGEIINWLKKEYRFIHRLNDNIRETLFYFSDGDFVRTDIRELKFNDTLYDEIQNIDI
jgi:hypothetical protein